MKKTIPVVLFIISSIMFLIFLPVSVQFIFACSNYYPTQINNNDFIESIALLTYAIEFFVISLLGVSFSIFSAKLSTNKIIKLYSYIETVIFSMGVLITLYPMFIR